jgi:hypothetical protein
MGSVTGVQFQAGGRDISFQHHFRTGCGIGPMSYSVDSEGPFLRVKWLGREANHGPCRAICPLHQRIYVAALDVLQSSVICGLQHVLSVSLRLFKNRSKDIR